jgi:hypothetical protein
MRPLSLFISVFLFVSAAEAAEIWKPKPGTTFSWFLAAPNAATEAQAVDLDLFEADTAAIAAFKAKGQKTLCYISVGAWEDWRPDKAAFPKSVIGKPYDGWPGERWLDIRQIKLLAPALRKRLDLCKAKGFDAVEPDNLDGYEAKTGFPLTRAHQVKFIKWIAGEAHRRGLSIGLKNVPDLMNEVLADFDWSLAEDCFAQKSCAGYSPMIAAGKAVFAVEYTDSKIDFAAFCKEAKALKLTGLLKRRDLDAYEKPCP